MENKFRYKLINDLRCLHTPSPSISSLFIISYKQPMTFTILISFIKLLIIPFNIYDLILAEKDAKIIGSNEQYLYNNSIYYLPPTFDVKNTNITFGSAAFTPKLTEKVSITRVTELVFAVCQAELINQKKTQFSIDGTINLIFQEYSTIGDSGQNVMLELISNFYMVQDQKN